MTNAFYEYMVLRYTHDPLTQETLNIGVLLYCQETQYLELIVSTQYGRLSRTFNGFNGTSYRNLIRGLQRATVVVAKQIFAGGWVEQSPESIEGVARQVLPPDDTSFRFGSIGGGLTEDVEDTHQQLYQRLVLRYAGSDDEDQRRDDNQIWHLFAEKLRAKAVIEELEPKTISTPTYEHHFDYAWKNDLWHPLEPVSLDLKQPRSIDDKASRWIGHIQRLRSSPELGKVYFLLGKPRDGDPLLQRAYDNAVKGMRETIENAEFFEEDDAEKFATSMARVIREHSPE